MQALGSACLLAVPFRSRACKTVMQEEEEEEEEKLDMEMAQAKEVEGLSGMAQEENLRLHRNFLALARQL